MLALSSNLLAFLVTTLSFISTRSWSFAWYLAFWGIASCAANWSSMATVASESADSSTSRWMDAGAGDAADAAGLAFDCLGIAAAMALEASLVPLLDSTPCLAPGDSPTDSDVASGSETLLLPTSLKSFAMFLTYAGIATNFFKSFWFELGSLLADTAAELELSSND